MYDLMAYGWQATEKPKINVRHKGVQLADNGKISINFI